MSDIMKYYIGIDPSTKSTGVAVYCPEKHYVETWSIVPIKNTSLRERLSYIGNCLWESYDQESNGPGLVSYPVQHVFIEESCYLGKANSSLQRLLGVIEFQIPDFIPITPVNPATIKKFCGGIPKRRCKSINGVTQWLEAEGMEKIDIAKFVLSKMPTLICQEWVNTLIEEKRWDESDALAVVLWGFNEISNKNSDRPIKSKSAGKSGGKRFK